MSNIFQYAYTVGLHDTDAAGLIFSANIIRICHQAYEAFLEHIGYGMDVLFARRTMILPVAHIEADFLRPLTVGQKVTISAQVSRIGESSYRMAYEVRDASGTVCATAASVQVCVDPKSRESMPIPADFKAALARYA